jgi:transposase
MSVNVGIDVHRKRSRVAVVTEDGTVQLNKNTVNGTEPLLRLIGDLPSGTPVASGAAFGWGWLADLLEDYGFDAHPVHPLRCKAIASARLKNDKAGAAILAQLLRADLLPEAWIAPLGSGSSARCCGTGSAWSVSAPSCAPGSTRSPPATAMTAVPATGPGRAAARWPSRVLPAASREIVADCLAVIDGLAPLTDRIDGELRQHAKADPRVKVLTTLPGVGQFTAFMMLAEIGDISRFPSASARIRAAISSSPGGVPSCRSTTASAPIAEPHHSRECSVRTQQPGDDSRELSRPRGEGP